MWSRCQHSSIMPLFIMNCVQQTPPSRPHAMSPHKMQQSLSRTAPLLSQQQAAMLQSFAPYVVWQCAGPPDEIGHLVLQTTVTSHRQKLAEAKLRGSGDTRVQDPVHGSQCSHGPHGDVRSAHRSSGHGSAVQTPRQHVLEAPQDWPSSAHRQSGWRLSCVCQSGWRYIAMVML